MPYPVSAARGRATGVAAAGSPYLLFDGNDLVNCGSAAILDDLPLGAFTVEAWAYRMTTSGFLRMVEKQHYATVQHGWWLRTPDADYQGRVYHDTTDGNHQVVTGYPALSTWGHFAMTYDAAGDRKPRLWFNGVLGAMTYLTASDGTYRSDAGDNLIIGNLWVGAIGWVRISNTVRYTNTFTPAARDAPPAADANTLLLLKMDEGSGNPQDSSGNANHGTITGATWAVG